jgi:hypothetical protein
MGRVSIFENWKNFSGPRDAETTNHVDLAEQTRGAVEIAETNATIGEARNVLLQCREWR